MLIIERGEIKSVLGGTNLIYKMDIQVSSPRAIIREAAQAKVIFPEKKQSAQRCRKAQLDLTCL